MGRSTVSRHLAKWRTTRATQKSAKSKSAGLSEVSTESRRTNLAEQSEMSVSTHDRRAELARLGREEVKSIAKKQKKLMYKLPIALRKLTSGYRAECFWHAAGTRTLVGRCLCRPSSMVTQV